MVDARFGVKVRSDIASPAFKQWRRSVGGKAPKVGERNPKGKTGFESRNSDGKDVVCLDSLSC
jgi:hypothetical protein